jgi:DNA-binding PadR family transcriptional regulator
MNSSAELDEYERKLLSGWEEIYKRGLLTMWLLLAVRDRPRYPAEIAEFIETTSRGTMAVDQRSLYRAMRRLNDVELVETSNRPGRRTGADRTYYRITRTGRRVLEAFLDRHIRGIYLTHPAADLFARPGPPTS